MTLKDPSRIYTGERQLGDSQEAKKRFDEFDRRQAERERRMREPAPRNRALAKILGPKTRTGIAEARKVIREWVGEHPEDRFEFGEYASDLKRKEFKLDEQEGRPRAGDDSSSTSSPS